MFLFCSLCRIGTTWTGTWPSNATAKHLLRLLRTFSPCWGLWAKPQCRGCRGQPIGPCCVFCGPPKSTLRRLIVVAARGLVITPAMSRPIPAGSIRTRKGGCKRSASFQLFDPQPRIVLPRRRIPKRPGPRIHMFNADNQLVTVWPPPRPAASPAPPPSADGMVNAARVIRRLEALESALADLPRQARRLVRWRMRQEKSPNPSFKSPLRPGRPPGHRTRAVHEVDELLSECHWLARYAGMPDTS